MFSIIWKTIVGIMLIFLAFTLYNIDIVAPTKENILTEEEMRGWAFPALFTYIDANTLANCINLRDFKIEEGVIITKVATDSTISASGFARGDVILMYNNERVLNPKQFIELLDRAFPSENVRFIVVKECKVTFLTLSHSPH